MTIRAFLALPLSVKQVRYLSNFGAQLKRYPDYMNIKWTRPNNYHLTMRFLGDIKHTLIDNIDQQLALNFRQSLPVKLEFNRLQLFPSASKPKVLAVTANTTPAIQTCLKSIDKALHLAGLHPKKASFTPHITIGRIPRGSTLAIDPETINIKEIFEFTELELIKSKLTNEGPIYTTLSQYSL